MSNGNNNLSPNIVAFNEDLEKAEIVVTAENAGILSRLCFEGRSVEEYTTNVDQSLPSWAQNLD